MSGRTNNGKSNKKTQVKHARSPYINFCSEQRTFLKEAYPELTFGAMGKLLGNLWKKLSEEEKLYYNSATYSGNSIPKDFSAYAADLMDEDDAKVFDFKNLSKADKSFLEDEALDNGRIFIEIDPEFIDDIVRSLRVIFRTRNLISESDLMRYYLTSSTAVAEIRVAINEQIEKRSHEIALAFIPYILLDGLKYDEASIISAVSSYINEQYNSHSLYDMDVCSLFEPQLTLSDTDPRSVILKKYEKLVESMPKTTFDKYLAQVGSKIPLEELFRSNKIDV